MKTKSGVRLLNLAMILTLAISCYFLGNIGLGTKQTETERTGTERIEDDRQDLNESPNTPSEAQVSPDEFRRFLADLFYDKNTSTWECFYPTTGEHEWISQAEAMPAADLTGVINRLNESFAEANQPTVQLSSLEEDTAIVTVTDDSALGESMGSAGASCYLAAVTYSLTSVENVDYVWFDITEGSHAIPGRYSRSHFSELWPLQTLIDPSRS